MTTEQKHILKTFRDQFSGCLVISTQDRRDRDIVPIAEIDDNFDEPMQIEQRQFANQMAERWNGYDTLAAKLKELEAVIRKCNEQTEHFERCWYLRGDEIEKLRAQRNKLIELASHTYSCSQHMNAYGANCMCGYSELIEEIEAEKRHEAIK